MLLSTLLPAFVAHAAPGDWSPEERGRTYALGTALEACIRDGDGRYIDGWRDDRIEPGNMDGGKWWFDGETGQVSNGYYSSPSFLADDVRSADEGISFTVGKKRYAGQMICNQVLQQAVPALGVGSAQELFCAIGGKRENGSSCGSTGSGKFEGFDDEGKAAAAFNKLLRDEVWAGETPTLGAAALYAIYQAAFDQVCQPEENKSAPSDFKYVVKRVQPDGTVKEVTYEGKKRDTKAYVYTNASDGQLRKDCAYIADKMNEGDRAERYADWIAANKDESGNPGSSDETDASGKDEPSSCAVDGVGWIICPVVNFMATIADGIYERIIANMLDVPPLNIDTADGKNGTYNAWSLIRNIANILFVIAFLIVIYAQITGGGLSNYAIKKLLPRIVIAAILVNLSYWLCAIAVDVSNITGAGIYDMLTEIRGSLNIGNINGWGAVTALLLSGGAVTGTAIGVTLAAGALSSAMAMSLLGILLPLLLGALLAIFIVVFILVARQALLVILIIASPLAFVAFLLPNTQQWFTKWRQWLLSLLLLYPIVSFMVGGAQIAGYVIIGTATSDFSDAIGDSIKIMSGLFVMVAPFFLLPFMIRRYGGAGIDRVAGNLKTAGSKVANPVGRFGRKKGTEALGRQWQGMKAGQVPTTRGRGRLGNLRRNIAERATGAAVRHSQSDARRKMESEHYTDRQQDAVLERLGADETYRTTAAGGDAAAAERLAGRADAQVHERRKKDAAGMLRTLDRDQRIQLAHGDAVDHNGRTITPDAALQESAIENVASSLDSREALDLTDRVGGTTDTDANVRRALVNSLAGKSPLLTGSQLANVENGTFTRGDTVDAAGNIQRGALHNRLTADKFDAEWMATKAKPQDIEELAGYIGGVTDATERARLQGIVDSAVQKLDRTPTLSAQVTAGTDVDQALSRLASSRGGGGGRDGGSPGDETLINLQ